MNFFDTLTEMLVLLFGIFAGYLANRLGILGGGTDKKISKLLLDITLPAMIVGGVCTGDELPEGSVVLSMLGVTVIFYLLEFVFVFLAPPLVGGTPGQRGVWRFTMVFGNLAFIGYPVISTLFGQDALFYAVILTIPFNLMAFTLGPLLLSGAKRFSLRQMFSPSTVAAIIALVLTVTRFRPPAIAGEALSFVGDITTPLSLMFIGSLLAGLPAGALLGSPRMWILAMVRLLALPAALAAILHGLGTAPIILSVAVVEMGMPAAVNGSLVCMEYGGDADCMAQLTFVSTLASMVTIPIVTAFLL